MEIIHLITGENPIQIVVRAVMNSGPREDSTRIGSAGGVRGQEEGVWPFWGVEHGNYFITTRALCHCEND